MTHPVSVLVVDDEPLLRISAVDFLADAVFMVYEASTADAIEVLGSRPDIFAMFTDIQMPDSMDGVALARKIERDWPGVFAIVASGHTAPADAELSSDVPFLTKPYLLETVAALIAKTLSPQVVASHAPSEDRWAVRETSGASVAARRRILQVGQGRFEPQPLLPFRLPRLSFFVEWIKTLCSLI